MEQHWTTTCAEQNGGIVKNTDDPIPDNNDPDPLRPQYTPLYGFFVDGTLGLSIRADGPGAQDDAVSDENGVCGATPSDSAVVALPSGDTTPVLVDQSTAFLHKSCPAPNAIARRLIRRRPVRRAL